MEDKKILSVENKKRKVVNMKENIFNDTDFSRFTSHFSLKAPLIQTLHQRTAYLPHLTCNGTFIYTRQINITSTIA